jgi:hypothetical protein
MARREVAIPTIFNDLGDDLRVCELRLLSVDNVRPQDHGRERGNQREDGNRRTRIF